VLLDEMAEIDARWREHAADIEVVSIRAEGYDARTRVGRFVSCESERPIRRSPAYWRGAP
jgi:hypothetical protein